MYFRYDPEILAAFPHICGGVIMATGVGNGPSSPALQRAYAEEQAAVLARTGESLSEITSLAAWRTAFRRFGVNPTKVRSASEALLRRLIKKGDIPSINTLVDIGNLVSIRYALPVAMFDVRDVVDGVTVHFAHGDERFIELGSDDVLYPEPGEVVFTDAEAAVLARRWCWRQSAQSAARNDTTELMVTVESQHQGGRTDIVAALQDLTALLDEYTGGERHAGVVDDASSAFHGLS